MNLVFYLRRAQEAGSEKEIRLYYPVPLSYFRTELEVAVVARRA